MSREDFLRSPGSSATPVKITRYLYCAAIVVVKLIYTILKVAYKKILITPDFTGYNLHNSSSNKVIFQLQLQTKLAPSCAQDTIDSYSCLCVNLPVISISSS